MDNNEELFNAGEEASVPAETVLGECPSCKANIVVGKYGAYCKGKCGMFVQRAFKKQLTNEQISVLLKGDKVLLEGLTSKNGNSYEAYIEPDGIEEFSYERDGETKTGKQFKFKMTFPDKKEE